MKSLPFLKLLYISEQKQYQKHMNTANEINLSKYVKIIITYGCKIVLKFLSKNKQNFRSGTWF
jgi:hypothetical protein